MDYALEYDSAEYYSFKFSTDEDLDIIIKKVFKGALSFV